MEGWPSELGDMPLGDLMLCKSGLEEVVGNELLTMRVPHYFERFRDEAGERIMYQKSVLEAILRLV